MSVVAFTFGSLGDILATAGLVANICQALYNQTDASLRNELQSFHTLLLSTHDVVQHVEPTPQAQNFVAIVNQTIVRCHLDMRVFLEKVDNIRKPLGWTSIGDLWGRVWWAAQQPSEIGKLKEKLCNYRQTLIWLIGALNV